MVQRREERIEQRSIVEPETEPVARVRDVDYVDDRVDDAAVVESVVDDPYASRRAALRRVEQGIYLLFGIIEALLAIRFVLRALGANPGAGFADFIYSVTAPFLAPFVGLFGTPSFDGAVLELHTIVAIVVYALVAWLIVKVMWLIFGDNRRGYNSSSRTVRTRR